ncbi:MAG TPA: hypothetical protein VMB25_01330 [Bryobacteraceae bacterium]|nr:hypothetical protein [Bryobacteraceae bacterium]
MALSLPTTTNNLGTDVNVEGQPHLGPAQQPIAQIQCCSLWLAFTG